MNPAGQRSHWKVVRIAPTGVEEHDFADMERANACYAELRQRSGPATVEQWRIRPGARRHSSQLWTSTRVLGNGRATRSGRASSNWPPPSTPSRTGSFDRIDRVLDDLARLRRR